MRKTAFCICENKDTDQLHGNRDADHAFVFATCILNFKLLTIFCGCSARFVRNPEGRVFHNEAHFMSQCFSNNASDPFKNIFLSYILIHDLLF